MCYFTQNELTPPSSPSDAAQCAIQGCAQMSLSWTALLAGYSELVRMRYISGSWWARGDGRRYLIMNISSKNSWC